MTKPLTAATVGAVVVLVVALGLPVGVAVLFTAVLAGPAVATQIQAEDCAARTGPDPFTTPQPATTPAPAPSSSLSSPPVGEVGSAGDVKGVAGEGLEEGGLGFPLPEPGTPRRASVTTPAAAIPPRVAGLYQRAAATYRLPWTLLAGIGMAETGHGARSGASAVSSAGAMGLMQILPQTFAAYGVDGDGDGTPTITSDADSVFTAAAYLVASGVTAGPDGVRRALSADNHADWYVNDVLAYAHAYGGGTVLGDPTDCGPGGNGNPALPPLAGDRAAAVLAWAGEQAGDRYVFGATGPDAWDCSSFTRAAYARIGLRLPRTAAAQRNWLAAGNGYRVAPGTERPGDLIFWDSYLGPSRIGHVMIVWDPATHTTIEAHSSATGVGRFSYAHGPDHAIYEIWRIGDLRPQPAPGGG